jgi:tetratricopeptide (TPR) repeat protein
MQDAAMNLTQQQVEQHNRFYSEAWKLITGEIILDGQQLPAPSWLLRLRLNKAKGLFEKAVAINPTGWNAMFAIGKIEQRLGRKKEALDWLLKAREFEPSNTSLAKEASLTASHLGLHEMAARIADEAIESSQADPALRVNAGLAHILAGHSKLAAERFGEARRLEPGNDLNRKLEVFATRVCSGLLPAPKSEMEIIRFVEKEA